MVCVVIAIVGMVASFFISYTPPAGSSKRITLGFVGEIYKTLKENLVPGASSWRSPF